jgi:hypothetical protein
MRTCGVQVLQHEGYSWEACKVCCWQHCRSVPSPTCRVRWRVAEQLARTRMVSTTLIAVPISEARACRKPKTKRSKSPSGRTTLALPRFPQGHRHCRHTWLYAVTGARRVGGRTAPFSIAAFLFQQPPGEVGLATVGLISDNLTGNEVLHYTVTCIKDGGRESTPSSHRFGPLFC